MRKVLCAMTLWLALASYAGAEQFTLTSPQLQPGGTMAEAQVFNGFGCSGRNISPAPDPALISLGSSSVLYLEGVRHD